MNVPLVRGDRSINNFFSATSNLKETNLTAYIAYLIAAFPDYVGKPFVEKDEVIEQVNIDRQLTIKTDMILF
jgi:hypothetical protein